MASFRSNSGRVSSARLGRCTVRVSIVYTPFAVPRRKSSRARRSFAVTRLDEGRFPSLAPRLCRYAVTCKSVRRGGNEKTLLSENPRDTPASRHQPIPVDRSYCTGGLINNSIISGVRARGGFLRIFFFSFLFFAASATAAGFWNPSNGRSRHTYSWLKNEIVFAATPGPSAAPFIPGRIGSDERTPPKRSAAANDNDCV